MKRVLKCDGLLPNKMDENGKFVDLQPEDIRQMKAYIDANRTLTTPFDIVVEGRTAGLDQAQTRGKSIRGSKQALPGGSKDCGATQRNRC